MDFTTNILLSIIVFLGIVLLLVALLLWVRNKLMPKGEVKITINDDKVLTVPTGNTLIATLAVDCHAGRTESVSAFCLWWQRLVRPVQMPCGGRRRNDSTHRSRILHPQADSGPLALGVPGEGEGKSENRGAAVDSEREGIRMHGGQQPQRGHFYQGVQGAAACWRTHGLRAWLIRTNQDTEVRHQICRFRQGTDRGGIPAFVGEIQDV